MRRSGGERPAPARPVPRQARGYAAQAARDHGGGAAGALPIRMEEVEPLPETARRPDPRHQ